MRRCRGRDAVVRHGVRVRAKMRAQTWRRATLPGPRPPPKPHAVRVPSAADLQLILLGQALAEQDSLFGQCLPWEVGFTNLCLPATFFPATLLRTRIQRLVPAVFALLVDMMLSAIEDKLDVGVILVQENGGLRAPRHPSVLGSDRCWRTRSLGLLRQHPPVEKRGSPRAVCVFTTLQARVEIPARLEVRKLHDSLRPMAVLHDTNPENAAYHESAGGLPRSLLRFPSESRIGTRTRHEPGRGSVAFHGSDIRCLLQRPSLHRGYLRTGYFRTNLGSPMAWRYNADSVDTYVARGAKRVGNTRSTCALQSPPAGHERQPAAVCHTLVDRF